MMEEACFALARTALMFAACAVAMQASAQAAAPTTTAFDGKYVATATLTTAGRKVRGLACLTVTSVDMTITGGQVVIHEKFYNGGGATFYGNVNEAGEIFGLRQIRAKYSTMSGTIHDKIFTGQHLSGHDCSYNVQMAPAPAPTMPFDGEYIGVSGESSKTQSAPGAECPPNGVPSPLTIWNGIVRSDEARWEGTVSPQGVLAMRHRRAARVDGQIAGQGIIRAQGINAAGCALTFVWRKQSG